MATRKLIKFGKNSFVVSLPKDWVQANNLQKGSELYVEQKPGSVILTSSKAAEEEHIGRIEVDGKTLDALETELTSAYKAGCTTIIITGKGLAEKSAGLKELIHYFAGAEIIEQDLHKIVIKDLIDVRQITLPNLINRLDMMVRSMFQDTLSKELVAAHILRDRDRDVNRIQLLVARVARLVMEKPALGNILSLSSQGAFYYDRIAWTLERIGDYLKRVNDDIIRSPPAAQRRLKNLLEEAFHEYVTTMKQYYQQSDQESLALHERVRKQLGAFTEMVRAAKGRDEILAMENIKNILRDLRIIQRITAEQAMRPLKKGV
jgi:phosphate uptake regulator